MSVQVDVVQGLVNTYRWWNGVGRETYYDSSRHEDFRVPYKSVRYSEDPSHYRRSVLERDSRYHEPVSVAYEPTDNTRRRMFVSNKRFGFRVHTLPDGSQLLIHTPNSERLLRNAVIWCSGLRHADVTELQPSFPEPEDVYTKGQPPVFMDAGMAVLPVCGNTQYIDSVLESLPPSGLYVERQYLPSYAPSGLWFENRSACVYSRFVEGHEDLRAEIGEYRKTVSFGSPQGYTTPGYSSALGETGIRSENGAVHVFWDGLWAQSVKNHQFLSQLLDKRVGGQGVARQEDLVSCVNPARFVLSHFLSTGSALILVKVRTLQGQSDSEALALRKAEIQSLPWYHINKTLPTSSNCVILYTVEPVGTPGPA